MQAAAFGDGVAHFLQLVGMGDEQSGNVFCRVVRLKIGGLIGDKGIAGGVSLIEGIASKGLNQGEDLFG